MNKRLFIQLTLLSIIVLITFLFYFKYLNNNDEIIYEQIHTHTNFSTWFYNVT